jgi:hypothetical protein
LIRPPTLLDDLALTAALQVPGATHSFLKQIAGEGGELARSWMETCAERAPDDLRLRWSRLATSFDNRRFFAAFGEMMVLDGLRERGWTAEGLRWPGPTIEIRRPDGRKADLVILSLIRQQREKPDREAAERLSRSLSRVSTRSRIVILVRRWLPHDFEPEPVRRAVEVWLREVDRGGWDGRYAAYDDENVSLEFALTGERTRPGQGSVALCIGPFDGHRALDLLLSEALVAIDQWRVLSGPEQRTLLLAIAADQPLSFSGGSMREVLYGKAICQTSDPERGHEAIYGPEYAPCVFRDPLHARLGGLLLVERQAGSALKSQAAAWINPWCAQGLRTSELPGAVTAPVRWEGSRPVIRVARPVRLQLP